MDLEFTQLAPHAPPGASGGLPVAHQKQSLRWSEIDRDRLEALPVLTVQDITVAEAANANPSADARRQPSASRKQMARALRVGNRMKQSYHPFGKQEDLAAHMNVEVVDARMDELSFEEQVRTMSQASL